MSTFYIRVRGQVHGPYETKQVQAMIRQGRVGRSQDVSEDGVQWCSASEIPELFPPAVVSTPASDGNYGSLTPDTSSATLNSGNPGNSNAAFEQTWRVARNNQELAPMRFSEMRDMAQKGLLSPNDQVWTSGMPQWKTAGQIPGLFDGASMGGYGAGQTVGGTPNASYGNAGGGMVDATGMNHSYGGGNVGGATLVRCACCGEKTRDSQAVCSHCGGWAYGVQPKRRMTYVVLGYFLGWFGAHNYYAGRMVHASVQLGLTLLSFVMMAIYFARLSSSLEEGIPRGVLELQDRAASYSLILLAVILVAGVMFKIRIPLLILGYITFMTELPKAHAGPFHIPSEVEGMFSLLVIITLIWTAVSAWSFLDILIVKRDGQNRPFRD